MFYFYNVPIGITTDCRKEKTFTKQISLFLRGGVDILISSRLIISTD